MQLERGNVGNGTVTSMKESVGFVKQASPACTCVTLRGSTAAEIGHVIGGVVHDACEGHQLACRIGGRSSCG